MRIRSQLTLLGIALTITLGVCGHNSHAAAEESGSVSAIANPPTTPTTRTLCDHLLHMRMLSFEAIREYLTLARDEYEIAVRSNGGSCEAVGFAALEEAVIEVLGDGRNISMVGDEMEAAMEAFRLEARRLHHFIEDTANEAVTSTSDMKAVSRKTIRMQKARLCTANLRKYSQQLFMWRSYLFSFGMAITSPVEECEGALEDVPLFKSGIHKGDPSADLSMCEALATCFGGDGEGNEDGASKPEGTTSSAEKPSGVDGEL